MGFNIKYNSEMKLSVLVATAMAAEQQYSMQQLFFAGYLGSFIHRNEVADIANCMKIQKWNDADVKEVEDAIGKAVNSVATGNISTIMGGYMQLGTTVGKHHVKHGKCPKMTEDLHHDPEMMKWMKKYKGANKALIAL